jgi:CheY-like chemotaxis protein
LKRRVLLADDEPSVLRVLTNLLEARGYEVKAVNSAAEALRKLDESVFDLILTDMRMETDTAGFAVAQRAKQQRYNPAVAILTANPSLAADWRGKGVDAIFVKGTAIGDMLRGIEELCRTIPAKSA